jgi:hypothetical protein
MLPWLPDSQFWVLQDHILRYNEVCGIDSDFGNALDGFRDMIPTFDFSSFTSKDIVPPKPQHVLASALFSKIVEDMEVNFQLTTRQKSCIWMFTVTTRTLFLCIY